MIQNMPDISTVLKQRVAWAVITQVNYADDTANISILDNNSNATTETYTNVPIFYNCSPTAKIRTNGALTNAASAFDINDNVAVKFMLESKGNKTSLFIISHLDHKKTCLKSLYLLNLNGAYLMFSMNMDYTLTQLTSDQAKNKLNLTINPVEGFLLTAQGHPTSNLVYACLPQHGEGRSSIDNYNINFLTHVLTTGMWGDTNSYSIGQLQFSPIIGSDQNYSPALNSYDYELSPCSSARHSYSIDSNNDMVDYGYTIQAVQVQATIRYNIAQGFVVRIQYKYRINYYNAGSSNAISTAYLYTDSGGGICNGAGQISSGDPDTWTFYVPVMAMAFNQMIIRKLSRTMSNTQGYTPLYGSGTNHLVCDTGGLNTSFSVTSDPFSVTETTYTYTEKLIIGINTILESLIYAENTINYGAGSFSTDNGSGVPVGCAVTAVSSGSCGGNWQSVNWTPMMITTPQGLSITSPGNFYIMWNPNTIEGAWAFSTNGLISDTRIGDKDLFVMAADTYNGQDNYIIFYGYGTRSYNGNYNAQAYGSPVNSIQLVTDNYITTYKMAWRVNGGSINKSVLTSWTNAQTYNCFDCMDIPYNIIEQNNTTIVTGQKIDNVSVQINAGFISYTYCLYDYKDAVPTFIHRVVGLISISDNNYPIGTVKEWIYTNNDGGYAVGVTRA